MSVEAVVEIPMGTKNKYEVDCKTGKIRLDRVQYSSMTYPAEYGYIIDTLEKDGDPLDVLILTTEPTFPGCIIKSKVIGVLKTIDNGLEDNKIIAINEVDPRYDNIKTLQDINEHVLLEIKNFFENYKNLQKIEVKVLDFYDEKEAVKIIKECQEAYKEK